MVDWIWRLDDRLDISSLDGELDMLTHIHGT